MPLPALRSRSLSAVAGVFVLGALACGDSTGPIVGTLEIVAGAGQTGPVEQALPVALKVRLQRDDGRPIPRRTVTWAVTQGVGQVSAATTVTDGAGEAQTVWTLGLAYGQQTVTATVEGLAPVTFTAIAVDPCDYLPPLPLFQTVNARLLGVDCRLLDGTFIDFWSFTTGSQTSLRLLQASDSFDTFLYFLSSSGRIIGLNDNADGGGTNSAIRLLLGPGTYAVGANSYLSSFSSTVVGPYSLSSVAVPEDVAGCAEVWTSRGIRTTQAVTNGDCLDSTGPYYSDRFVLVLYSGQSVTVTLQSTEFNAYLFMFDGGTGTVVASDDDGGGGTDARIAFTAAATSIYVIDAGTALTEVTGAYTLTIQ